MMTVAKNNATLTAEVRGRELLDKTSSLVQCNFLVRMLYKDIY